jgi:hypothetical protein
MYNPNMKINSTVVPILLLVIAGLLAGLMYQNSTKETPSVVTPEKEVVMEQKVSPPEPKVSLGTITGKLCFPSEGIPPLDIYLQNTATQVISHMTTPANQGSYTFDDLAAGDYIVFSYPQGQTHIGGGFTEAVPCGLSVSCTDHSPIELTIGTETMVSGADICDWYGADIPPKP